MYGTANVDLYGARVAIENGALGERISPIATTIDHAYELSVGWNGTEFIVLHKRTDLFPMPGPRFLRRIGADGTPVGTANTMIAGTEATHFASLAWNGSNFLLAWIDDSIELEPLAARRMSSSGTFLETTPIVINLSPTSTKKNSSLGVVAVGGDFVIAHQTNFNDSSGFTLPDGDVYGAAVKADGTLSSPTETLLAGGAGSQDFPSLASDGTAALLVWRDTAGGGHRILAARLDTNLVRLDGTDAVVAQAAAPDVLGAPAVAWTGTSYAALWSKSSGGALSIAGCVLGTDCWCVPGSEVALPAGISAPSPDAGASPSMEGIQNPSLVWTGGGGVFFYRWFDSAPFVNRMRLFAKPGVRPWGIRRRRRAERGRHHRRECGS